MSIVNILSGSTSAADLAHLAGLVDKQAAVPSRIERLGLFTADGIMTTVAQFDITSSGLVLVQSTPRGTDAPVSGTLPKNLVSFNAVRIARAAQYQPSEIQDIRRLGTDGQLDSAEAYFARKLRPVINSVRGTLEWQRLGALKGLVVEANGQTITNLYDEMGVDVPATRYFDFDNATPGSTAIRDLCEEIVYAIGDALGGTFDTVQVHAFVGRTFFNKLVNSPEVRATYLNQVQAAELRGGTANGVLIYGGIVFEVYSGFIGATKFVADDEARFFPVGVPELYQQLFAPADRLGYENSLGQMEYALPFTDPKNRFLEVEIQSNPITLCLRPEALIGGNAGAAPAPQNP